MSSAQKFKEILNSPVTINVFKILSSKKNSMTVSQFLEKLSENIDKEIIKTAKQGNLTPVAGDLKISVKDDKHLSIFWEFYYTDSNNKYHKTQSEKVIDNSFLTDDSITRIKTQPLAFPIDPPSIKG